MHDALATQCDPGIIGGLSAAAAGSQPLLRRVLNVAGVADDWQEQRQLRQFEPAAVAAPNRVQQGQLSAGGAHQSTGQCKDSCDSMQLAGDDEQCGSGSGSGSDNGNVCSADAAQKVPAPIKILPQLVSGAGHDALAMAEAGPMGMLFVRCRNGGISHSPEERVDDNDVAAAAAALLTYIHAEVA